MMRINSLIIDQSNQLSIKLGLWFMRAINTTSDSLKVDAINFIYQSTIYLSLFYLLNIAALQQYIQ